MSEGLPPHIDPVAAARWHALAQSPSPWLHEEVASRMQQRLQWIVAKPQSWCHWDPLRGGLASHALVRQRLNGAQEYLHETSSANGQKSLRAEFATPWWQPKRWGQAKVHFGPPAAGQVQMLWANMALHMAADPQTLMQQWHQALDIGGYVLFSCLGPDSLRELHALYAALGWPVAGHGLTDMHDWGDMLVNTGFADPVMDMERITLSFATPQRLLQELRGLGRNLHPQRFPALRGKAWQQRLKQALAEHLTGADGQLSLTFEVIYGHAVKPSPRVRMDAQASVSLQDMRSMLRAGR